MAWQNAVAGAGEVLTAADLTENRLDQERFAQQARRLAMEEGIRQNTQAQQAFQDQQAVRNISVPDLPAQKGTPIMGPGGPGENIQEPVGTTPNLPATPDVRGRLRAEADYWLSKGNVPQYTKTMAAVRGFQAEGLGDFAHKLLAGSDPQQAAAEFSQVGNTKVDPSSVQWDAQKGILTGKRDNGQPFVLDARRTLMDLGLMPQNKLLELGEGSVAVDPVTGETKAFGRAKTHHIDPYGPEAIAAKKDLEDYKAKVMAKAAGDPAKLREVAGLAKYFGADDDPNSAASIAANQKAIELAYGIDKSSKSEEERVLKWANALKGSDIGDNPEKLLAKAKEITKAFATAGEATNKRPTVVSGRGAGPVQLGGPGSPNYRDNSDYNAGAPPTALATPNGGQATFTGKFTKENKPIYSDGKQQYVGE